MPNIKHDIKRYKKSLEYTYAFGVFPTIELLKYQSKNVTSIILSPFGERNEGLNEIRKLADRQGIRIITNQKLILKLAKKENTYAIGQFNKYTADISRDKNHIVLVNPSDAGNLGTIIRTMIGLGYHDIAIIGDSVDIFDPRVVRSAMGGVFQMNFQKFRDFDDYKKFFPKHNYYPFMLHNSKSIQKTTFTKPYSLIFGNEGHGLDESFYHVGTAVKIDQTNNIDSLNLAISCAIAMYAVSKF